MLSETDFYDMQGRNVIFSTSNHQIKPNLLQRHDPILHPRCSDTLKLKWDIYIFVKYLGCPLGQHMGQVKVPLKMRFFRFLVTDFAMFLLLTLPLCLLSCSKEVLSIFSLKKIIKAGHNRENHPNYGRPPDHGIHLGELMLDFYM
jgi:hypothetical protein